MHTGAKQHNLRNGRVLCGKQRPALCLIRSRAVDVVKGSDPGIRTRRMKEIMCFSSTAPPPHPPPARQKHTPRLILVFDSLRVKDTISRDIKPSEIILYNVCICPDNKQLTRQICMESLNPRIFQFEAKLRKSLIQLSFASNHWHFIWFHQE